MDLIYLQMGKIKGICLYTKLYSLPLLIIYLLKYCYGLNVCSLPNSDVEILTPSVMVSGGGAFGR